MKAVSENVKNALKKYTTQRKGKILVNDVYYEIFNVDYYADCYEDGNVIGSAIASQLDFDLPYMEKFDTFKYFEGVWTGEEYEYIDMGTFHVFDEQDEDEFNKHITAFDNLIKFNVPFVDKQDYPKTMFSELQNICEQAGIELENESIPNGAFEIENNQFVNGESLKSVLKAICQVSGTYAMTKEDKLVLQLKIETDETIDKSQHKPTTWKRKTYGINQVILGMQDVEGEYVLRQDDEDIALNGIHKLVINNNPFAYTQAKRDMLIDGLFEQVKGFGYIPYEMEMEWLPYLEIGDTVQIDGIETLVLRILAESPMALKTYMAAPAIIDGSIEYVNNTNSIKNIVKRTELIVDKNNQQITAVVENQGLLDGSINGVNEYDLTADETYQEGKEYYKYENDEFVLLEAGVDYQVGDNLYGNIYEYFYDEGLEHRVSRNELNITSQGTTIEIISTNINSETGDVEAIKTTSGYTFDADGLKMYTDKSSFNSLMNNEGSYYMDGDAIVSQTTKDGTITKDMVLYGRYYYGVDPDLDVASFQKSDSMFVAELYTDENGEQGFGHFYNGGE